MKYDLELNGYVGGYSFNQEYVRDYLNRCGKEKNVKILISSLGGLVADGLAISSAIARHGNVSVCYTGLNASAATIASMGAKNISIESNAMYLVHRVRSEVFEWSSMTSEDIDRYIEELKTNKENLEKFDGVVAQMYANRCKKEKAELLELMKKESWLTAEEALEWGFVDEIVEPGKAAIKLTNSMINAMNCVGTPIPVGLEHEKSELYTLVEKIANYIGLKSDNPTQVPEPIHNPKINSMVPKFICEILGVESLESKDSNVILTEEQVTSIENRLAAAVAEKATLTNEKATLSTKVTDLEAKVAELSKKPAEETHQVHNEPEASADDETQKYLNARKEAEEALKFL